MPQTFSALILAVMVGFSLGQTQQHPNSINNGSTQKSGHSQQSRNPSIQISLDSSFSNHILALVKEIESTRNSSEKKQDQERAAYPIKRFWLNGGIDDWTITGLTFCLLVAVILQLKWSKKTFKQLEDEAGKREAFDKTRLRARLNVGIRPDRIAVDFRPSEWNLSIVVRPIISNDGETAADSIQFFGSIPYTKSVKDLSAIREGIIRVQADGFRTNGKEMVPLVSFPVK